VQTHIRSGATIGAGATIVCGNEIGRYAFVGAGAVVTRNVPAFALVVGNPARQVGWMCVCANKLPIPANMPLGSRSTCPNCHREFEYTMRGLLMVSSPDS